MADLKEILKKNKKKALAFAVATAFSVGIAGTLTGCDDKTYEEEEEEENTTSGITSSNGGRSFWHSFRSGNSSSSSSSKSSISKSSGSKSSGYSGAKGGSSSS